MSVYARKVTTKDPRFSNRSIQIGTPEPVGAGVLSVSTIPVPDNIVLCNGCNFNIVEDTEEAVGYLIYLSKRELKADQPYDIYCYRCTRRYFPNAVYV